MVWASESATNYATAAGCLPPPSSTMTEDQKSSAKRIGRRGEGTSSPPYLRKAPTPNEIPGGGAMNPMYGQRHFMLPVCAQFRLRLVEVNLLAFGYLCPLCLPASLNLRSSPRV